MDIPTKLPPLITYKEFCITSYLIFMFKYKTCTLSNGDPLLAYSCCTSITSRMIGSPWRVTSCTEFQPLSAATRWSHVTPSGLGNKDELPFTAGSARECRKRMQIIYLIEVGCKADFKLRWNFNVQLISIHFFMWIRSWKREGSTFWRKKRGRV